MSWLDICVLLSMGLMKETTQLTLMVEIFIARSLWWCVWCN